MENQSKLLPELDINTLLNPDFGMNDEGLLMHVNDSKMEEE